MDKDGKQEGPAGREGREGAGEAALGDGQQGTCGQRWGLRLETGRAPTSPAVSPTPHFIRALLPHWAGGRKEEGQQASSLACPRGCPREDGRLACDPWGGLGSGGTVSRAVA